MKPSVYAPKLCKIIYVKYNAKIYKVFDNANYDTDVMQYRTRLLARIYWYLNKPTRANINFLKSS